MMHKSLAHSDRQRELLRADAAGHAFASATPFYEANYM